LSSRRSKLRNAIPGVLIKGRKPLDPNAKPGPAPQFDGITVRPSGGKSHFDSDYFAPPPGDEVTTNNVSEGVTESE